LIPSSFVLESWNSHRDGQILAFPLLLPWSESQVILLFARFRSEEQRKQPGLRLVRPLQGPPRSNLQVSQSMRAELQAQQAYLLVETLTEQNSFPVPWLRLIAELQARERRPSPIALPASE